MDDNKVTDNPWTIARRRAKIASSVCTIAADRTPLVTLLSLPLEICAEIASYLSSTAVYRLTCSCRGAYQLFNPALYHTIFSAKRSESLLRTLSSVPQNAQLVRHIDIEYVFKESSWGRFLVLLGRRDWKQEHTYYEQRMEMVRSAISNLFESSSLRSFSWRSNVLFEKLTFGQIEETTPLPHTLRRLSITSIEIFAFEYMKFFSYIRDVRALEYFAFEEPITDDYEAQKTLAQDDYMSRRSYLESHLWGIMNSLRQLHLTALRTLKLAFNFNHQAVDSDHLAKLFDFFGETMNELRFPLLRTLSLHVRAFASDRTWELFDFCPFLDNHPNLVDVAIDLHGLPLDPDTLPALQRFEGVPSDSLTVLGPTRPLETVKLWMPVNMPELQVISEGEEEEPDDSETVLSGLASTISLRDLTLTPDTIRFGRIERYWGECFLYWDFIPRLARACPFLHRLELYSQDESWGTFTVLQNFHSLETLNLHLWQWLDPPETVSSSPVDELPEDENDLHLQCADSPGLVAEDFFRQEAYQREISRYLLPKMPDLKVVQLEVLGAIEPRWESILRDKPAFPQVKLQYEYRIVTKLGKRVVICE